MEGTVTTVGLNEEPEWCEGCQALRRELTQLQSEHELNYTTLKQKIISTDLLIKKFSSKCQEYEAQGRKLEEVSKLLETYQRDCGSLEARLMTSLQELEPLKEARTRLEKSKAKLEKEVQNLRDKLSAAEVTCRQFSQANEELMKQQKGAAEGDQKTTNKKIQILESSIKKKDETISKIKGESSSLRSALAKERSAHKRLSQSYEKNKIKLEHYYQILRENGLIPRQTKDRGGGDDDRPVGDTLPVDDDTDKEQSSSASTKPLPLPGPVKPAMGSSVELKNPKTKNISKAPLVPPVPLPVLPSTGEHVVPAMAKKDEDADDEEMESFFFSLMPPISPLPGSPCVMGPVGHISTLDSSSDDESYGEENCDGGSESESLAEIASKIETEFKDTLKNSPCRPTPLQLSSPPNHHLRRSPRLQSPQQQSPRQLSPRKPGPRRLGSLVKLLGSSMESSIESPAVMSSSAPFPFAHYTEGEVPVKVTASQSLATEEKVLQEDLMVSSSSSDEEDEIEDSATGCKVDDVPQNENVKEDVDVTVDDKSAVAKSMDTDCVDNSVKEHCGKETSKFGDGDEESIMKKEYSIDKHDKIGPSMKNTEKTTEKMLNKTINRPLSSSPTKILRTKRKHSVTEVEKDTINKVSALSDSESDVSEHSTFSRTPDGNIKRITRQSSKSEEAEDIDQHTSRGRRRTRSTCSSSSSVDLFKEPVQPVKKGKLLQSVDKESTSPVTPTRRCTRSSESHSQDEDSLPVNNPSIRQTRTRAKSESENPNQNSLMSDTPTLSLTGLETRVESHGKETVPRITTRKPLTRSAKAFESQSDNEVIMRKEARVGTRRITRSMSAPEDGANTSPLKELIDANSVSLFVDKSAKVLDSFGTEKEIIPTSESNVAMRLRKRPLVSTASKEDEDVIPKRRLRSHDKLSQSDDDLKSFKVDKDPLLMKPLRHNTDSESAIVSNNLDKKGHGDDKKLTVLDNTEKTEKAITLRNGSMESPAKKLKTLHRQASVGDPVPKSESAEATSDHQGAPPGKEAESDKRFLSAEKTDLISEDLLKSRRMTRTQIKTIEKTKSRHQTVNRSEGSYSILQGDEDSNKQSMRDVGGSHDDDISKPETGLNTKTTDSDPNSETVQAVTLSSSLTSLCSQAVGMASSVIQKLTYVPSTTGQVFQQPPSIVRVSQSAVTVVSPETSGIPATGSLVSSRSSTPSVASSVSVSHISAGRDSPVSPLHGSPIHMSPVAERMSPVQSDREGEREEISPLSPLPPSPTQQGEPLSPLPSSPTNNPVDAPQLSAMLDPPSTGTEPERPASVSSQDNLEAFMRSLREPLLSPLRSALTPLPVPISPLPQTPKPHRLVAGRKSQVHKSPCNFHSQVPPGAVQVKPKHPETLPQQTSNTNDSCRDKTKIILTEMGSGAMSSQAAALQILRNQSKSQETERCKDALRSTNQGHVQANRKMSDLRSRLKQMNKDSHAFKPRVQHTSAMLDPKTDMPGQSGSSSFGGQGHELRSNGPQVSVSDNAQIEAVEDGTDCLGKNKRKKRKAKQRKKKVNDLAAGDGDKAEEISVEPKTTKPEAGSQKLSELQEKVVPHKPKVLQRHETQKQLEVTVQECFTCYLKIKKPNKRADIICQDILSSLRSPHILADVLLKATLTWGAASFTARAMIDRLLKLLEKKESDMTSQLYGHCVLGRPPTEPVLATYEQRTLELLSVLHKKDNMNDLLGHVSSLVLKVLMSKSGLSLSQRLGLVRVYTALCRMQGNVESARVWLYWCMYNNTPGFSTVAVTMAGVWPHLLTKAERDVPSILSVMEYLVMKTLAVEQPKLIMCMTSLCKWTQPSHDAMQLGRDIIGQVRRTAAEDRENKKAILFEQQKALELLCVHEGWQWTNNTLIRELLWPVLQEWGAQQPPTPSSNMVVEFALRMMGLVSCHCPPEHASSAHEIMKTLYTFLKSAQQSGGVVSWSIQTAVFESLLYLAPFSPELVSTACNSWGKENKDRMTEGMLGKVRGFYQCYMNKCPVLTLPDFVKASL
ncbi:uncharacterized protein LOC106168898 isoform X2 [Lingula anatina]|uniref:Uncharacterized protein LOC106168898 isoform X2 n=1 Tax=Lingula anatina TaxID=7574 RepID=A0A1S3IZI7_LINAN|nr:uncharacterized protein LOC106168898 isoform X2 [Lingula anatina]|eukprot:XP_013403612.1 uncharacterized protein LOC106168898 isoform X2 [Lingula anatina]